MCIQAEAECAPSVSKQKDGLTCHPWCLGRSTGTGAGPAEAPECPERPSQPREVPGALLPQVPLLSRCGSSPTRWLRGPGHAGGPARKGSPAPAGRFHASGHHDARGLAQHVPTRGLQSPEKKSTFPHESHHVPSRKLSKCPHHFPHPPEPDVPAFTQSPHNFPQHTSGIKRCLNHPPIPTPTSRHESSCLFAHTDAHGRSPNHRFSSQRPCFQNGPLSPQAVSSFPKANQSPERKSAAAAQTERSPRRNARRRHRRAARSRAWASAAPAAAMRRRHHRGAAPSRACAPRRGAAPRAAVLGRTTGGQH